MAPRQDISEQRRQEIMDAALAVFSRLGFEHASMDDIAKEAGVSKGALYLYYKSKDAIIAALLKYFFEQELKHLQALVEVEQSSTVTEQLLALTRQMSSAMGWMTRFMPIAFEFYAIAGRDREVRQFLQDYFKTYCAELARLIQRGIDTGEFRPANAQSIAITFTGMYEGLALLSFVDPQACSWPAQVETSVQLLLEGMRQVPPASD